MINQNLIIYDFPVLFDILSEVQEHLNFKLLRANSKEYDQLDLEKFENFLVLAKKNNFKLKNKILINDYPIKIIKLIEIINIQFLQKKFNQQSEIDIGNYKLNLNSRKIFNEKNELNLTEKEADVIIFLKKSKKPVTINELQTKVWGYNSKLDTHTVETHIYRLRKKFFEKFNNEKFIISLKSGYNIK